MTARHLHLLFIAAILAMSPFQTATAISTACANLSLASFPTIAGITTGQTIPASVGPFAYGDLLAIGTYGIPNTPSKFELVDERGNTLAGPFTLGLLIYAVPGPIRGIGVKNVGVDAIGIYDAGCTADPYLPPTLPIW